MFLHLGGDVVVPKHQVIAIMNTQLMKKAEVNREFIQLAEDEGFVIPISDKTNAKSIIITSEKVYLSPISSMTLKKRSDDIIENIDESTEEEPW